MVLSLLMILSCCVMVSKGESERASAVFELVCFYFVRQIGRSVQPIDSSKFKF
jgi:hypothetical protein